MNYSNASLCGLILSIYFCLDNKECNVSYMTENSDTEKAQFVITGGSLPDSISSMIQTALCRGVLVGIIFSGHLF